MSITAIVENGTITLPAGLDVPNGTTVEITLPGESANPAARTSPPTAKSPAFAWMLRHAGTVNTLPEDFSEHHTEYRTGRKQR